MLPAARSSEPDDGGAIGSALPIALFVIEGSIVRQKIAG
jgi:hypothetical protein